VKTKTLKRFILVLTEYISVSLRVCLVSLEVFAWGRYGGVGKTTRDLAAGLSRRGVEVDVVVPRAEAQGPVEELDGFTVHGHGLYGYPFTGPLFRRIGADVYHSQEPGWGTMVAMGAAPEAAHVVTCHNPRGWDDWERANRFYGYRRRAYNRYVEPGVREAVRRADAVFCQSRHIQQKARLLYGLGSDPGFLPNPVAVPAGKPAKAGEPTVCFLGRLDPEKNPERLARLARSRPDVRFLVAGRAHDERRDRLVRHLLGDFRNVELRGFVEGPEKDRLLDESWVLVNTSHMESLPIAFLEAAAHGCAVLSPHDPDGFTTRFGRRVEGDGYETGLAWLLDGDRWRERGEAGHRYVSEVHEEGKVIDLHLGHYERVLEARAPTPRP
jgi:glycosyltransferase involved in cell wall biosynthesis